MRRRWQTFTGMCYCHICGIDGPTQCTEQANCLNVSPEVERHSRYVERGRELEEQAITQFLHEYDRSVSTVRGFLGYKTKPTP